MPLEIKRKPRESAQGLVRRFSQYVRKSGILVQARKIKFRSKPKSDLIKKRSALRRERKKREYRE